MEQIKVRARITKQGDSELAQGTEVEIDDFAEIVNIILREGGEMPVAIPISVSAKYSK